MCCILSIFAKCVLCVLNAIIVVGGGLLTLAGFVGKHLDTEMGFAVIPGSTAGTFIAFGCMMVVVGVLGYVVGFFTFKIILWVYAAALLLMAALLLSLSIYGLSTGLKTAVSVVESKEKNMTQLRQLYNLSTEARKKIDRMQGIFQCCGVLEPAEWRQVYEYPESCCPINKAQHHYCALADIYKEGCKDSVTTKLHVVLKGVYGMVMLFGFILIANGGLAISITIIT